MVLHIFLIIYVPECTCILSAILRCVLFFSFDLFRFRQSPCGLCGCNRALRYAFWNMVDNCHDFYTCECWIDLSDDYWWELSFHLSLNVMLSWIFIPCMCTPSIQLSVKSCVFTVLLVIIWDKSCHPGHCLSFFSLLFIPIAFTLALCLLRILTTVYQPNHLLRFGLSDARLLKNLFLYFDIDF